MNCPRCGAPANPSQAFCLVCAASLHVTNPPDDAPSKRRVTATDAALAQSFGRDIVLGRAFAFIGAQAFRKQGLSWVQRLLGGPAAARAQVVSLLDREPVALPGAVVSPSPLASLWLGAVTSDKALYREGRDEVHLLVVDPLAPGVEVVLEIKAQGVDFAKRPARLDARGAAAVTLRDLPTGDYEIRLRGAPSDAPACAFTVAAYRLAPLVASLADRRLEGDRLAVTLRLERFGQPVDGGVQLELSDRGQRIAQLAADARDGVVTATFTLRGEGPHSINVQLVADPSHTATVPIVGSRASERSLTTFSTLGYEVQGSLLPAEGSTPVRGIHLSEGAIRTSPFRLDRVDTGKARLTATVAVETARIVMIDPTFPGKRPGAVDVATCPHPASTDVNYVRGEGLFQGGHYAEARAVFEEVLASAPYALHPNYAYYVACCFAREGDKVRAMGAINAAIRDGWTDFELMARDEDLAALRGYPPYEALKAAGGQRETVLDDVPAGKTIEIDVPAPMAILAVGAYIGGEPWEGWAALVVPEAIRPQLTLPERALPGGDVRIHVDTGVSDDALSLYLIVKDARLLTADTPESRLAGGLKAMAEIAARELTVGKPTRSLADALPQHRPPPPPASFGMPMMNPPFMSPPGFGAPPPAPGGFGPPPGPPGGFGPPPSDGGFGAPPPPMAARGAPALVSAARARPPMVASPMPMVASPMPAAAPAFAPPPPGAPPPRAPSPYREAPAVPPPSVEEPELLFAGLVETRGGKGVVSLRLGPDFADYLVSAFVIAGRDWAPVEGRFRAEREVYVSLDLPAFVHPEDGAVGKLHVRSQGGARVRLSRDGVEVPLVRDGRALAPGASIEAGRSELSFLAGPGYFEAVIEDGSGAIERVARQVDVPGKLRRVARTVRFLEAGQRISRAEDPSVVSLRVLPGLDAPFRALVDATSDYGHACCEQTAAKMLAACAMYTLAGDRARRDRAEAIIVAGVRREASMWLRGKGFRMYPDSAATPDAYWGPKAARYLWNLALLRDLKGEAAPGRALGRALDEGLAMAADATSAYSLEWPPRRLSTCEDAYNAVRFGTGGAHALSLVDERTRGFGDPARSAGGAVVQRAEAAYGAAALLRAGGVTARQRALALANAVIAQIGPEGRLYSTVDSVAAIALMAELDAVGVLGGAAAVAIDGERLSSAEALRFAGEIRAIEAVEGVTAVEVGRVVEEDWATFHGRLPIAVRLLRGQVTTRRLNALDAVDLEVKLESGYKPGDLLWVCLPDALSRVVGGGQVKRFSLDFQGNDTLRVSLAATGVTVDRHGQPAPARFAVCVRNMFEEERGGNPGLLEVTVAPPPGAVSSGVDRVISALKGALGS